ncbi:hypothetical protein QN277_024629 [Acacia crassicarpa]|uniref:Fungal lipase-type domain-containing protein n=1 Tax=Acacia crassicarpa TaxID=499986 RepID=A0AAE1MHI4_9FABA|nr:hypothetical protein QN277_024629 [Acacia crassicarpa]
MRLPLRASHQPPSTSLPDNSLPVPFQLKAAAAVAATTTNLPFKKSQLSWIRLKHDSPAQCELPKLRRKWMEYQGSSNWDGMLDPLDDTLRHEILRYGQFVDAAYRSFDFDMSSPTYAMSRFPKRSLLSQSGIHKSGYRITRNLRATCGIHLPKWLDRVPWKFSLSSWIGYVAVCHDKGEIARLGRRDVVISLRGTSTCLEWLENARAALTSLPEDMGGKGGEAMVEKGFLSLYTSKTPKTPSLREMVREEVKKIIRSYGDEPLSLTLTGHSLGAALAILSAYDIATTFKNNAPMVTVVSFGGPRVGNESFRRRLEQSGTKILRIVNSDDVITKVPGFVARSDDVAGDGVAQVGRLPEWLHKRVEDLQWVYADVGQELRLSSRESPNLKNLDLATCHDLKTYLLLVNDFVSSKCPCCTTKTKQYPTAQACL